MFLDRYIRDFDDITKDVGQELKDTARRIYTGGIKLYKILLVVELVFLVIESVWLIVNDLGAIPSVMLYCVAYVFAAVLQYYLFVGIIHRITIGMYAKGEIVHMLKKCSGDVEDEEIAVEVVPKIKETKTKVEKIEEPAIEECVEPQIAEETQEPDEPVQAPKCSKAIKLLQRLVGDTE